MLKTNLCVYNDPYILVSGIITITIGKDATEGNKGKDKKNKKLIFKNCTSFIECTSKKIIPKQIMQNISIL